MQPGALLTGVTSGTPVHMTPAFLAIVRMVAVTSVMASAGVLGVCCLQGGHHTLPYPWVPRCRVSMYLFSAASPRAREPKS